ncbi:AcrR family transcriptional regulator [Bacillus sp. RC218]|uniref:TetR/AcrR family transcriptional regulator n=1 Tax=Bacillus TaxID=1386 RepID=UPI0011A0452A|nr:TetR/AcrR family transcriptional regulator [Bacillus mycoides]
MNKKKRDVLDKAHELFIEQGYHATSIQDILNHSNISKGSFYNYFSSKGELFKAVFKLIQEEMQVERDKLLIGEDCKDIAIYIEQVSLMMELNKKNKLMQLIEDVLVSNDPDLIQFIKQSKYLFLSWVYKRFANIFPEDKSNYLVDCAVIFIGMMQNILHTSNAWNQTITIKQIVTYCMDRIIIILEDISEKSIQLFTPAYINEFLPQSDYNDFFNNEFSIATLNLKKVIEKKNGFEKQKMTTCLNLLYFIQEEIMYNKADSRKFLIESALTTLKNSPEINATQEYIQYEQILGKMDYFPIS